MLIELSKVDLSELYVVFPCCMNEINVSHSSHSVYDSSYDSQTLSVGK